MILLYADEIYKSLLNRGFSPLHAKMIVAQSAHETAGFTSHIFKSNHNCFGMKYAGQSSALGEKNGYAYYNSISQSTLDYKHWFERKLGTTNLQTFTATNLEQFVNWLKTRYYFEDSASNYLRGCDYFYKQIYG